jgi:hypothetical protein
MRTTHATEETANHTETTTPCREAEGIKVQSRAVQRQRDEARCDAGGAGNSSMISLQSCDYSKGGEMFDFIPPEHHIETFVSCNIGANLLFLPCSFDLLRL